MNGQDIYEAKAMMDSIYMNGQNISTHEAHRNMRAFGLSKHERIACMWSKGTT